MKRNCCSNNMAHYITKNSTPNRITNKIFNSIFKLGHCLTDQSNNTATIKFHLIHSSFIIYWFWDPFILIIPFFFLLNCVGYFVCLPSTYRCYAKFTSGWTYWVKKCAFSKKKYELHENMPFIIHVCTRLNEK